MKDLAHNKRYADLMRRYLAEAEKRVDFYKAKVKQAERLLRYAEEEQKRTNDTSSGR